MKIWLGQSLSLIRKACNFLVNSFNCCITSRLWDLSGYLCPFLSPMFSQMLEPTQHPALLLSDQWIMSIVWPALEAQSPTFPAGYGVCVSSVQGLNCKIRPKHLRPKMQISSSFLDEENILLTPTKPNTTLLTLASSHNLSSSVRARFPVADPKR